ncbi:MAG: HAMP domain-containing protein [Anaerolineae bacterium]|nr:HAMP domain-containing protein [Anaerolineae bacterium]
MMTSIRWRIAIPYVLIIVLTTAGLTATIAGTVRKARLADLQTHLLAEARWTAAYLQDNADWSANGAALPAAARQWSAQTEERLTLIDAGGVVRYESHADLQTMDNHLYRPEIQSALRDGQGVATRYSQTLRRDVMYAAVAVRSGNELKGFVRLALPLGQIEANVNRLSSAIILAGMGAMACAGMLAIFIASHVISPIQYLTQVVKRVADGDMSARLLPTSRDEVGQLTRAFNTMADQLRDKVATLAQERGRLSAVLDTMADGVIITDDQGTVSLINRAAARILHGAPQQGAGHTFAQVVYNHELVALWEQCRQTGREQIATVETVLHSNFLQAIATPLPEMNPPGFLVILQDLTQVRRLETVRRDFISNISHELRTPLASLALVVETLQDGAIDDKPAAQRFLAHMESEVAALIQMVEELLELARIESGKAPLDRAAATVAQLVEAPVERLRPQAERKGITLAVTLPQDLPHVHADAKRIHQVIGNLIHNAIKFTPEGGAVTVSARSGETDEVIISVSDTGSGIPAGDLPRIFERFYKVDHARTKGGTGLGLAIAKHIVQSHGGRIWVESVEGKGSTFHFSLPAAPR